MTCLRNIKLNGLLILSLPDSTDEYIPSKVKTGEHAELILRVANYAYTPWKAVRVVRHFKTIKECKEALIKLIKDYPELLPSDLKE